MQTSSGTDVVIRKAESRDDFLAAFSLIEELAKFEHLTPPDETGKQRFLVDGLERQPPRFEIWLAESDGIAVGYILVFETYSSFLCKPTLYLEDLFVMPQYRRQGIGTKLLNFCVSLAKERNCGRMEWTCLYWNTKAQLVYDGMGATKMREWLLYRMTGNALKASE